MVEGWIFKVTFSLTDGHEPFESSLADTEPQRVGDESRMGEWRGADVSRD